MGLIGSVFAVASVAGPLLGGFVVDNHAVGALAVLTPGRGAERRASARPATPEDRLARARA